MPQYDVHGIRLSVASNWPRFNDLVNLNLRCFPAAASGRSQLDVRVDFVKKPWLAPRDFEDKALPAGHTWGTGLALDGTKVTYSKGHLSLEFRHSEVSQVRASYLLDRRSRALGFFKERPSWEECQLVMRLALYHPLFHLLEARGLRLLHSAAVADEQGALLLMGLNGSGKSSLCYALLDRFHYMSDNFLFLRDNEIYAFPETLRLPLSADPAVQTMPYPTVYGKRLVPVPMDKMRMRSTPRNLLFVARGNETRIERTPKAEALRRIRMIADMTHEFPRYGYLGLLSDHQDPSAEDLASGVDSFVLEMSNVHRASDLIREIWPA